jgi:anti-sigma B factor antagonist
MSPHANGHLSWEHRSRHLIARLKGELDLANAAEVFDDIRQSVSETPTVIDLTAVSFIDSTTVGEIVKLARTASLRVVAPSGTQPHQVLELTGVARLVPTVETLDDATQD